MRAKISFLIVLAFALIINVVSAASTTPAEPRDIQIFLTPDGRLAITWQKPKAKNIAGYVLYKSSKKGKIGEVAARLDKMAVGYYDVYDLHNQLPVYYTVRSLNKKKKESKNKTQVWFQQRMPLGQPGQTSSQPLQAHQGQTANQITNPFYRTLPCEKNNAFKFTHSPMTMSDIFYIDPPGGPYGRSISPISNIIPPAFSDYTVSAPVDALLVDGSYYSEPGMIPEYTLILQANCNFIFTISPLVEIPNVLKSVFPAVPKADSRRIGLFTNPVKVKGGEVLGTYKNYQQGRGLTFMLQKGDHRNAFVNPFRRFGGSNENTSVCPYDYFEDSLKNQFYGKFASNVGGKFDKPVCRSASQDVEGTIRGEWYTSKIPVDGQFPALAITTDYGDNTIFIANERAPDYPRMTRSNSTFKLPEEVTTQHCYISDNIGGTVMGSYFFKVISKTEMQLAADPSATSCPSEFPAASAVTYYR